MTIVERVKSLNLPLDQLVVIGSGIVDALDMRASQDIDLAVSGQLFEQLRFSGDYQVNERHGDIVLERDDVEIWQDWGDDLPYDMLARGAVVIGGVQFCHPATVLRWKQDHGRQKDTEDIQLLRQYLGKTA
ncbi:MAG: hypothetical protein EOO17_03110 [Chloroflexi bacterium]|nr:MAG: hypothetical protein EOO17_03110 [Chloroflexota bacterium]